MMVSPCGGCGHNIGYVLAAQYRVRINKTRIHSVVVCPSCWNRGIRMWLTADNDEPVISIQRPAGYHEAVLYYDEGSRVSHRTAPGQFTYPEVDQPSQPRSFQPRMRRVLLLASYCELEDTNCTEKKPCPDCLQMCNVAFAMVGVQDVVGQFNQQKDSDE